MHGFPWAPAVTVERKAGESEVARLHRRREGSLERLRDRGCDLVLDRHVQPGRLLVLRGEQAVKPVGKPLAQVEHRGTGQPQRGAPAEVDHPLQPGPHGRRPRLERKRVLELALHHRRQRVKQRDVRPQVIALGREVRGAQLVGARLQRLGQFGGDDQRSCGARIVHRPLALTRGEAHLSSRKRREGQMRIKIVALGLVAACLSSSGAGKPASEATIAAQRAAAAALPPGDGTDAAFARRGFIATRADPIIRAADGRPVWNLAAYDFVQGPAPATVNPSLWRHASLLAQHGLFQVTDGVWQVRGFDLSNMTVIAGKTGWILVDPLTTREAAAAALALVNQHLGARPVSAVIYSHSHGDHYGGVRGVVDEKAVMAGKVAILAPEHFTEEATSENIMAGAAMGRRATFQFATALEPGIEGQMTSGIGPALSAGEITLIAPTDTIGQTGETRVVDGVALEFQIASGSEAPSEMNVWIAPARAFLAAEIATCSFHNILTPRGAKVRDAHAWAGFLDEALQRYAPRSDVLIASHCWPRFGQDDLTAFLAAQRDNYRYLHDQTVRHMNRGATMAEIAEEVVQPPVLAQIWANRGYYGTYRHNAKAIYQHYLGWYDGVPARLDELPPVPRAQRYVAAMGGVGKVLALARKAFAAGDYRWASDLGDKLVFADPANRAARELLADSYEQQGYQAESAIWRNQFLSASQELRKGAPTSSRASQSADLIAAVSTRLLFDSAATRYDPAKLGRQRAAVTFVFPERNETASLEGNATALFAREGAATAGEATVTGPRRLVLGLLFLKVPLSQLEAAGLTVTGDRGAVEAIAGALDPMPGLFPIAEP
jgi:alkyl sulfatase BDS1-like metallo-beta-lactamase superfamily hydrolase